MLLLQVSSRVRMATSSRLKTTVRPLTTVLSLISDETAGQRIPRRVCGINKYLIRPETTLAIKNFSPIA